jgi:hypothetical protein
VGLSPRGLTKSPGSAPGAEVTHQLVARFGADCLFASIPKDQSKIGIMSVGLKCGEWTPRSEYDKLIKISTNKHVHFCLNLFMILTKIYIFQQKQNNHKELENRLRNGQMNTVLLFQNLSCCVPASWALRPKVRLWSIRTRWQGLFASPSQPFHVFSRCTEKIGP